jgi:hypothetical protein
VLQKLWCVATQQFFFLAFSSGPVYHSLTPQNESEKKAEANFNFLPVGLFVCLFVCAWRTAHGRRQAFAATGSTLVPESDEAESSEEDSDMWRITPVLQAS